MSKASEIRRKRKLHRGIGKKRLSDFSSPGAMINLVPRVEIDYRLMTTPKISTREIQEQLVEVCKKPLGFSLPHVTEEEVKKD